MELPSDPVRSECGLLPSFREQSRSHTYQLRGREAVRGRKTDPEMEAEKSRDRPEPGRW